MILGDRLEALMKERGFSQAELARRVGVSQPTIFKALRSNKTGSVHLHTIAHVLRTTPEYLTGVWDDPSPSAEFVGPGPKDGSEQRRGSENSDSRIGDGRLAFRGFPSERDPDDDSVAIDQVDVSFGMGATFLDADVVPVERVRFSRAYLRTFTEAGPEHLFVARGIGDSMNPTIQDSDVVLVDRSQRVPQMHDRIWAMSFAGMGMIKRLRPRGDGAMRILSDNPSVPEDLATDGELFVIGRVVAIVRKV